MERRIFATCLAAAAAFACAAAADAAGQDGVSGARPASAASTPTAGRLLKFEPHEVSQVQLTLRREAPIRDGWSPQVRFAGQADPHACIFHLPKAGQVVRSGETAIATIRCTSPWQVQGNGLSFEAFEGDRKVAEGTLRP